LLAGGLRSIAERVRINSNGGFHAMQYSRFFSCLSNKLGSAGWIAAPLLEQRHGD